jgi:hypothetical protein
MSSCSAVSYLRRNVKENVADPASALSSSGRVARLLGGAPSQRVLGVIPAERQSASCQQVAGIILRLYHSRLTCSFLRI